MKTLLIILITLIGLSAIAYFLFFKHCWVQHNIKVVQNAQFVLPYDFEQVRKTMVRTDALEKTIEACGTKLIEKKMDNIQLSSDRIIHGHWLVEAEGTFKLQITDEHFNHVVPVALHATITPTSLKSTVSSIEPVAELQQYQCNTFMQPMGNETLLRMEISIVASFTTIKSDTIDKQVNDALIENAQKSMKRMQQTIAEQVNKYKGKKILLKLK
jgi:hypothetical protein